MKKIAFFCARNWGSIGTSGTYNFVIKLKQYYEVRVFSPVMREDICVFPSYGIPLIPIRNPVFLAAQNSIQKDALIAFDPDLVYIFNSHFWPELAKKVKGLVPRAKILLDVKTPFLLDGEKRIHTQKAGIESQSYLNRIITLSVDSVNTWIPKCNIQTTTYPCGIDTTLFKESEHAEVHNRKFIFVGSLSPRRNIDKMIMGFAKYVQNYNESAALDIYGTGKDFERLNNIINIHEYSAFIALKGNVNQNELFEKMHRYDAGIAWVPKNIYNESPSLKILEYMSASIPVIATDTNAHINIAKDGFKILMCKDTSKSLCESLCMLGNGSLQITDISNNKCLVQKYDYKNIIDQYIRPTIQDTMGCTVEPPAICATKKNDSVSKKHLPLVFFMPTLAGGRGGAEKVALDTAKEMSKRGHIVYLMYSVTKNSIVPVYPSDDTLILLPYRKWEEAKNLLVDIDPSVLMVFYFNREIAVHMIPFLAEQKIPVCFQECTNPTRLVSTNWKDSEEELVSLRTALWERDILSAHATRIRLVMPSYKESFQPMIQTQVRAFPNPCKLHSCNRTAKHQSGGKKYVFIVNAFKKNKNFPLLLRAFQRISPDFPDWNIITVGKLPSRSQNQYADEIYDLVKELKLEERVELLGPTDDIFSWYAKVHIHVITSFSEGCPTVVLEAMSMGLPSIGFADCPGTNELIRHEKNGLLVDAENREKNLAAALQRLMENAELRDRLGKQAFEDAKNFTPQKIYDQWEEMFLEASEYKNNPDRLLREQIQISKEAAIHTRRMLSVIS